MASHKFWIGSLCKNDQTNTFGNSGVSAFAKPDVNLRRGSPAFTGIGPFDISYASNCKTIASYELRL